MDLIGGKAFAAMVVPGQLIRRIVATVDNLPRPAAPRRTFPLKPVPGRFVTAGSRDQVTVSPTDASTRRARRRLLLFGLLAAGMIATRRIDWYVLKPAGV